MSNEFEPAPELSEPMGPEWDPHAALEGVKIEMLRSVSEGFARLELIRQAQFAAEQDGQDTIEIPRITTDMTLLAGTPERHCTPAFTPPRTERNNTRTRLVAGLTGVYALSASLAWVAGNQSVTLHTTPTPQADAAPNPVIPYRPSTGYRLGVPLVELANPPSMPGSNPEIQEPVVAKPKVIIPKPKIETPQAPPIRPQKRPDVVVVPPYDSVTGTGTVWHTAAEQLGTHASNDEIIAKTKELLELNKLTPVTAKLIQPGDTLLLK